MTGLSEQEIFDGHSRRLDTLERAAALQGAFMKVLQRVIVRFAAELSKQGAAEAVERAMIEGAQELTAEAARLKSAGYAETLAGMLDRFEGLKQELKQAGS